MNRHCAIALLSAALFGSTACLGGSFEGRVVAVQDGDTLTVLVVPQQVRVRLLDIDAPESKQPFGTRSRQSLAELCHGRAAFVDDRARDRYGRALGQVSCAGVDAHAEQARRGMAWVVERYAPARVLELKTSYREGTSHLVMSPLELMQRPAPLVLRPRMHLIRFHGVLAPHAKLWAAIVHPASTNISGNNRLCESCHVI